MLESEIQAAIRIALGRLPDLRLFRNNVGVADVRGSKIRFGLMKGSSDLIGFLRMIVDGKPWARFLSFEIKTDKGIVSEEQKLWIAMVQRFGGFACVVRSVEEAMAAVQRAREGAYE